MKVYITFSGAEYESTTGLIVDRGPKLGANTVWVYDDLWLTQQEFYVQNRWLWDHPHKRGFGWYAWKPFIIADALTRLHRGDIVLYTDADCYPIAPLHPLFEQCKRDGGIMLSASENHRQGDWCKRDCFVVMGQDEARYREAPAGVARFMLFQKGSWRATQFLMEWLAYSVNPLANTFDPSVLAPEHPGFIEHRAEQAIMTNLAHKYGLKLYREACEAGNCANRDRELYGQLFTQDNPHEEKVSAEPVGSIYASGGVIG